MSTQRERFQELIDGLVKQARSGVELHDWVTKPYPKKMRDSDGQLFEVPALFMQRGPIRVLLDPVAFDVPGAEAAVDLYLMPTYDDVASLFFEGGKWMIHYAFPSDPTESHSIVDTKTVPFSEESIVTVLDSIAEHAEP